jgi:hypothetical protein
MSTKEEIAKMIAALEAEGLKVSDPRRDPETAERGRRGRIRDIKMEKVNVKDPIMWFAILESECEAKEVDDARQKFSLLRSLLTEDLLDQCRAVVLSDPAAGGDPYMRLKTAVLGALELTPADMETKLDSLTLGTQKPSALANRMVAVCGEDQADNPLVRAKFLSKLGKDIRLALAPSHETDIRRLARAADTIHAELKSCAAAEAKFGSVRSVEVPPQQDKLDKLTAVVASLAAAVEASHRGGSGGGTGQGRGRGRGNRERNRPGPGRLYEESKSPLCFYHWRYGEAATQCKTLEGGLPCKWPGNALGGAGRR